MEYRRRNLILGFVLIAVGGLSMLARFLDLGRMTGGAMLWIIAGAFFVAYSKRHEIGFLIAGSMVAAVGTFVLLQALPNHGRFESGGLFFMLIGLAFVFVYLVGTRPSPWPLFPALATMVFGAFILSLEIPAWGRYAFPSLLILAGLWLIFRPRRW